MQRAKYRLIIEKVSCYEYKKNLNCSPQWNLWQKSNPCLSKPLCVNFMYFERFQCVCVLKPGLKNKQFRLSISESCNTTGETGT